MGQAPYCQGHQRWARVEVGDTRTRDHHHLPCLWRGESIIQRAPNLMCFKSARIWCEDAGRAEVREADLVSGASVCPCSGPDKQGCVQGNGVARPWGHQPTHPEPKGGNSDSESGHLPLALWEVFFLGGVRGTVPHCSGGVHTFTF